MYERNAIVLDRFFNQMFGYNMKNNIKTNFKDYSELVESLEKYKNISEEEEEIIQEYDSIANKIREIQRLQDSLNKKNAKMQEERASIFQGVGENAIAIQKKLDNVNSSIEGLNEDIKENAQKFVDIVSEFNDKTSVRTSCGKTRRNLEAQYNKKLNETLDHYQDIDVDYERKAKQFLEMETESIENEIKEEMKKNGEKEKIPFNSDVLTKAITLCIDIQKRETDILTNIYDRTNRLFTEIKNNTIKSDKHKKTIKDAKSKLDFIGAIREYLVQFLDNERLTAVNGEEEHSNLMKEACKNLDEDIIQINNLYTLLIKESTKKITKKSYSELYNVEYLRNLEKKAEEFDNEIKKLNLPVTIINPNYWRIEGMKKIYDVFYKCVTENYERDLSEYMPQEEDIEDDGLEYEEDLEEDIEVENENEEEKKQEEKSKDKSKNKTKTKKDAAKAEIDKKIDKILGFEGKDEDYEYDDEEDDDDEYEEEYDDYVEDEEDFNDEYEEEDDDESDFEDEEDDLEDEEEDFEESNEDEEDDDDVSFDIWGNNINRSKKGTKQTEEEDDDDEEYDFEDDDDNIFDDEDEEDEEENDDEDEFEDEFEDEEDDDYEEEEEIEDKKNTAKTTKKRGRNSSNSKKQQDNWEDEFVNIEKKEKTKKKRGFFDKFKK